MTEQIQYRNPVKAIGYAQIHHIATLDDRISDGAYRLFALYIMHAQQKEICWPGRLRLAKMFKCSEQTISRRNTELQNTGYITREKRIGTSSITYIENIEEIPYLKNLAQQKLDDRRTKNGTSNIPKMVHSSYQKCIGNNNKYEEEQEEEILESDDSNLDNSNEPKIIVANLSTIKDDTHITCPTCEEKINISNIPESKAKCVNWRQKCYTVFWIRDDWDKITHRPPQEYRNINELQKNILGDLFADCPPKLRYIEVNHKTDLVDAYKKHKSVLWDCLRWARGKVGKGNMSKKTMIKNALSWFNDRLEAKENDNTESTDERPEGYYDENWTLDD